MRDSLHSKLYTREISDFAVRSKTYRKLYTDRSLIDGLDIVNELAGHSGCVNALSWSKSGSLLASGSDDQHLNIYTYQPAATCSQFQLTTTVATGHTQNIFSVKFMPHSNDRTVITAAGDGEVRIFDLEHTGQAANATAASSIAAEGRRRGRRDVFNGVRYLSDGDTNCRVYRSHDSRVKRIVTESSPHLFLTCAEDGEVRQWDLRQPSSAYPAQKADRFSTDTTVPPPLISYKRYGLDINTISCSASQPHYIVLGGAHLHAFLHDRRMCGRDRYMESGQSRHVSSSFSSSDQDELSQATQCVRKFAPKGQKVMRASDSGHITACKISDARPDEMVVSWSSDHIYSFDLIREVEDDQPKKSTKSRRVMSGGDKKRKRQADGSQISLTGPSRPSQRAHEEDESNPQYQALRIRYQNGQSEDIPLSDQHLGEAPLTDAQRAARRVAQNVSDIRSELFSRMQDDTGSAKATLNSVLSRAGSILLDMDEIMRSWRYPVTPSPGQVLTQRRLRGIRESARRFVQAAGTICRVMGAQLRTPSGLSPLMNHFGSIDMRNNDIDMTRPECFTSDFLKAILVWLDSGVGSLVEGFTRPSDMRPDAKAARRLPIPESDASVGSLDELLIPHLRRLAPDTALIDHETNRFETDENRAMFSSGTAAVSAFASAIKIPFADLSSTINPSDEDASTAQVQDRQAAREYWAFKVARGVLFTVQEPLDFAAVDRAFGGVGQIYPEATTDDYITGLVTRDNDEQLNQTAEGVAIVNANGRVVDEASTTGSGHTAQQHRNFEVSHGREREANSLTENTNERDLSPNIGEDTRAVHGLSIIANHDHDPATINDNDHDNNDNNNNDDDEDETEGGEDDDGDDGDDDVGHESFLDDQSDSSSEADEEDGVPSLGARRILYAAIFKQTRSRSKVERHVSAAKPTRTYRGHLNVRTIKDVNYFGPDDAYVVSGSDDGNLFIWDRKSAKLVNILEGDGEVVNVIQGHPYETMMAVSGIDHTIKIFSPDARAREIARLGQGVSAHDPSAFSSIAWPMRFGGRRSRRDRGSHGSMTAAVYPEEALVDEMLGEDVSRSEDNDDYVAPNGLESKRRMQDAERIVQKNSSNRQLETDDAFVAIPRADVLQLLYRHLTRGNF